MLDIFDRVLLLKTSKFFADVKTEDLSIVAQALEGECFSQGDIIFYRGDYADKMYLVESGHIGIAMNNDKKTDNFVVYMKKGDWFGEMGILDEQPRTATAHILEDASLLVLTKEKLKILIGQYPDLSMGMLKSLCLRLRDANEQLNKL